MNCVDFSKCKVVYYSFLLLKVSAFQRLLSAIPSLDRRIKKIETICHCKIKIDCVDRKKCNKVLDAYHLIEVYYNESNGNHSGCIYMFKEILKDYGNVQTVITINKSKDGRIFKRNYMTDNASYQLFQNSKIVDLKSAAKLNLANDAEFQKLERHLSKVINDKLSEKSDLNLPISQDLTKELSRPTIMEMIEHNLSNSQNSADEEMVFSSMNDDQLLHHYALNRSIHSDLKLSKVVIKSNASEVVEVDRNINSGTNFEMKAKENYLKLSDESLDGTDKFIEISLTETNEDFESIKEEFFPKVNFVKSSNESKGARKDDRSEELILEGTLSLSNQGSQGLSKNETISFKSIHSENSLTRLKKKLSSKKESESKIVSAKDLPRFDVLKELKIMINKNLEEKKVEKDCTESHDISNQIVNPNINVTKGFEIRKKPSSKNRSGFDISIDDTFNPDISWFEFAFEEENDEFVSAISNTSSLYQSSSTEYDDAISHSSLEDVSYMKEKCSNFSRLISKFEVETSENSNYIDDFIDEVASVYFEEYRVYIKHKLKQHIDAVKFSTTQLGNSFSEIEISKEIEFIAAQTIENELKLWNDLINFYVKIINTNLWRSIRKVSEESVSQSNTEQLRLETLFEEVLSSKVSKSVQEIDSTFSSTFVTAMTNLNSSAPLPRKKVNAGRIEKSNLMRAGKKEKIYMKYIKQQRNSSNYFNPSRVQENLKLNRKVTHKSAWKTIDESFSSDLKLTNNINEKLFEETNDRNSIRKSKIYFPVKQSTFYNCVNFPYVRITENPLNQSNIETPLTNINHKYIKTVNSFIIDYGKISKDFLEARNISNNPGTTEQNNLNHIANDNNQKSIQKMSKDYLELRKLKSLINKKYFLKRSLDISDCEYLNYKKRKFLLKRNFLMNKKIRFFYRNSLGGSNYQKSICPRNIKSTSVIECHLNSKNYVKNSKTNINASLNLPIQSTSRYPKLLNENQLRLLSINQDNSKAIHLSETGNMPVKQFIIRRKNKLSKSVNQKHSVSENTNQINEKSSANQKLPENKLQFISMKCRFNQTSEKVNLYRKFSNDKKEIHSQKFNNNKKILCGTVSIITIINAEITVTMTPIAEKAVELSDSFYRHQLVISNQSILLNKDYSWFTYNQDRKIIKRFDKNIEIGVKKISFIICVTMDIDLVMRNLYLEIFRETVIDNLKSKGNPNQISSSSDYCTVYSYDKEFDSFILDEF